MENSNKLTFLLIVSIIINDLAAQDLIRFNNEIASDTGIINGSSTVNSHITKYGMTQSLEEFDCGLTHEAGFYQLFTISQQADLVYCEMYFDSTHKSLKTQGYYRLYYINSDIGYCWKKDLIWNEFAQDGTLISLNYFERGILKPAQYLFNPE